MSAKKRREKFGVANPPAAPVVPRPPSEAERQRRAAKAAQDARWNREAIESVVVAIILAFLFRAFEAEAFVIPTGSMAPTLRGRYVSVRCEQCGHWHQAGASIDEIRANGLTAKTLCPMCQFPNSTVQPVGIREKPTYPGLNGDRILVNKFAYDFWEPQRWDVIVFKFPANAKQNFIKRLIGLPGETLRIEHGDVFTRTGDQGEFVIQRKPESKVKTLLLPVHDTQFIPESMVKGGWPTRWQPLGSQAQQTWSVKDGGRQFDIQPTSGPGSDGGWLRYQHILATPQAWAALARGEAWQGESPTSGKQEPPRPSLITDFYAYNAKSHQRQVRDGQPEPLTGGHWVGDLAVTCDLAIDSDRGTFVMELVESTRRYQCHIDVSTGQAKLLLQGEGNLFDADAGAAPTAERTAPTPLRGGGRHTLRFANVDDQLWLWVDGKPIEFPGGTTFTSPSRQRPQWSPSDPGDLAPIGLAAQGLAGSISRLQVHRDVYYVAVRRDRMGFDFTEYDRGAIPEATSRLHNWLSQPLASREFPLLEDYFRYPEVWREGDLFDARHAEEFTLEADQFFPMGDNSPSSKDARLWEGPSYVQRQLLLGKAFLIYYPQGQIPGFPGRAAMDSIPVVNVLPPDVTRMGPIR